MCLVEGRQADEAMYAALGPERAVGVLAANRERRRLQAGLLSRARLEQFRLESAVGRPAEIHAQHHLGPALRIGATGAADDGDDRVARVVLPVEEGRFLEPLELAPER